MLNSIITGTEITVNAFLICTAASLVLGILTAVLAMFRSRCTQSFAVTLALLPTMVQVVIMLVNGNIGAGVAVAGAFSLIRFRSVAGSAREIGLVFLAMSIGLAVGMGYVALAAIFFVVIAAAMLLLTLLRFGAGRDNERELKITIPENLDYDGIFDDLLQQYTLSNSLDRVRTTNMGTLYELTYKIVLKDEHSTKAFLDALRCRNGNLNITCGKPIVKGDEL